VIAGCLADEVDEIVSSGNTLQHWRIQILAHHLTSASNGPTEAINNLIKRIKQVGFDFRRFANYRIRVLFYAGRLNWDLLPSVTPR
jgi:transposase